MNSDPKKENPSSTTGRSLVWWTLFFLSAGPVDSALFVDFSQVGNDMVVTVTGLADVTGAGRVGEVAFARQLLDTEPNRIMNILPGDDVYQVAPSGSLFTGSYSSTIFSPTALSGDSFGLLADDRWVLLYVPDGFVLGNIEGTMTFRAVDLTRLAPIEQQITWGSSADQSIQITVGRVPEPTSGIFLKSAFLVILLRRCRASREPRRWD